MSDTPDNETEQDDGRIRGRLRGHLRSPRVEIEYCTMCRWLLRAGWTAQELLTTFPTELAEVALVPGTGGTFDVRLDGELIYSRKAAGGFPELKHLKQLIRDRIDPERDLGHSDRPADATEDTADDGAGNGKS